MSESVISPVAACNIKFKGAKDQRNSLITTVKLLYRLYASGLPGKGKDYVISEFNKTYGKQITGKITSINEITDRNLRDFINIAVSAVGEVEFKSPENLSDKGKEFLNIFLSQITENANTNQIFKIEPDINNAGVNDETLKQKYSRDLHLVTVDVYGVGSSGLSADLQDSFVQELTKLLIYDKSLAKVLHLNQQQVNNQIRKYREAKYQSIRQFLIDKGYKIEASRYLYDSNGFFNTTSYNTVINAFRRFLESEQDLHVKLGSQYEDKIKQRKEQEQQNSYKELLNILNDDPRLKAKLDSKFDTVFKQKQYQNLYLAGRFSNYYYQVIDIINTFKENNPDDALVPLLEQKIKEINNPQGAFLEIVQDYFKLANFDDLLNNYLSDQISYNKAYQRNGFPNYNKELKYTIRESTKHQTSGFESYDKENSESHTGTTTKAIIKSLYVFDTNNPSLPTTKTIELSDLVGHWEAFIKDLVYGKLAIKDDTNNEIKNELLECINNYEDPIHNIQRALEILFADQGVKRRYVGNYVYSNLLGKSAITDQTLDALYSFYKQVLDPDNPESIWSLEIKAFNASTDTMTQFLPITGSLIGVLYRNVPNSYVDTSLNRRTIGIKAKFNWNGDLFDAIEGCNFSSKLRQFYLLGVREQVDKYQYKENISYTSRLFSVNIGGSEFGFLSPDNYGMFSPRTSMLRETMNITKALEKIDLVSFAQKLLEGNKLDDDENLLREVLQFIDYYLKLDLLSESGLGVLNLYKTNFNKRGETYLDHLIQLAVQAISIDYESLKASDAGLNLQEFLDDPLSNKTTYSVVYKDSLSQTKSTNVDRDGSKIYFVPLRRDDEYLSDFIKYRVIHEGRSIKSTSKSKAGDSVPNSTISRLGSELRYIIPAFKKDSSFVGNSLLFVNDSYLKLDPVVDSEVTTLTGEIKSVVDMTTSELFQHAIFDKFYKSFIDRGEILFQPTVYSDKLQFLNYFAEVLTDKNGKSYMMLTRQDVESTFQQQYVNTVFRTHQQIYEKSILKLGKLFGIPLQILGANGNLIDVHYKEIELEVISQLRKLNAETLSDLIYNYNNAHPDDQIVVELDKDYRLRTDRKGNQFCDINEITRFYGSLSEDKELNNRMRQQYFAEQKKLFAEDLKSSNLDLTVFSQVIDRENWIKEESKRDYYSNYLLQILSDPAILGLADREAYAKHWIDANTGELLIEDAEGNLNPFFENFFYIEGLYSNNLRLLLTGSEINHPDKASFAKKPALGTLFDRVNGALENADELKAVLAADGIAILNEQIPDFVNLWNSVQGLDDVRELAITEGISPELVQILESIYFKSIIPIINVAQGTQFKRNVVATATQQHPIQGRIDGCASEVLGAVIMDEKAPVGNLRESDKIDACDGSARMSPIQVNLENNCLDEQKVGINRKPIWSAMTSDLTLFEAKFAAFGITNSSMLQSIDSSSSLYRLFKKMHNIRWNGTIDLMRSIRDSQTSNKSSDMKIDWFKDIILQGNKLFYKDVDGQLVNIEYLNSRSYKGHTIYYTNEIINKKERKIYHFFNAHSEHYAVTEEELNSVDFEQLHTIDSLFELYSALGGVYCCDSQGAGSELNLGVLTQMVINVGYKKNGRAQIKSAEDVVQPLKDKFIAYAFNNTAVKCGAKNMNASSRWSDDKGLNTFKISTRGLGIQLNADHSVEDSELTEFSQVIAACSAYGKDFSAINEIYFGLAKSAFEESSWELECINDWVNQQVNPDKARWKLYQIVAKLILRSGSNSDMDLTDQVKQTIEKELKTNRDQDTSDIKLPFSDPTLYKQFITSITSVINAKSIKRKHPGSGYVMSPGYNVIQYYPLSINGFDRYMFQDIVKLANKDYRSKLVEALKQAGITKVKQGLITNDVKMLQLAKLKELYAGVDKEKIDVNLQASINKYEAINTRDIVQHNRQLVAAFLEEQQQKEPQRNKEWFMPTDNVDILDDAGNLITTFNMDAMDDFYRFKNQDIVKEITEKRYNVKIKEDYNGRTIIQLPDTNQKFVLERIQGENAYYIHFSTGEFDEATQRRTNTNVLEPEQKLRLFQAAIERLPVGAELRLSNTTAKQLDSGIGGLTLGSVMGFNSLNPLQSEVQEKNQGLLTYKEGVDYQQQQQLRVNDSVLENVGDYQLVDYFVGNEKRTAYVSTYKKVAQNNPFNHYRLNITRPVNLKPSLVRWQYIGDDGQTHFMTIYDHPIIRKSWNEATPPTRAQIQELLDNLDEGFFTIPVKTDKGTVNKRYNIIPGTLENTEAEIVLGNMYKNVFGINNESLADIMQQKEQFFNKQIEVPSIPKSNYDFAFTKQNGSSVLVTVGELPIGNQVTRLPFNPADEIVRGDEIYYNNIKVGKYVDAPDDWTIQEVNGSLVVVDKNNNIIDNSQYFIIDADNELQRRLKRRVNFVERYELLKTDLVNGIVTTNKYTLYRVIGVDELKNVLDVNEKDKAYYEGLSQENTSEENKNKAKTLDQKLTRDAYRQISNIIKNLYNQESYSGVLINTVASKNIDKRTNSLAIPAKMKLLSYLDAFVPSQVQDETGRYRNRTAEEIKKLSKLEAHILKVKNLLRTSLNFESEYKTLTENYYQSLEGHKVKWASFLNSLHFISSRIPAQSLQSFMPMRCVGWTGDSGNTAYVSYIQTFLQGSDYDIDKAYVMGQSFDDDGKYVGWSNLFDYNSEETLQISKKLPIPRGFTLRELEGEISNIDISSELSTIINAKTRVNRIKAYVNLVKKLDSNQGKYTIKFRKALPADQVKTILERLQKHENWKIPYALRTNAYKNVSSANIFNVVHNIRNRDQAYSQITMSDLRTAAQHSPKGNKGKTMNMLNPLVKYRMQYENVIGKKVIGIAANGEKDWFNLTYYYHDILRNGSEADKFFLKMHHKYTRIQGRAKGNLTGNIVRHIPDLWLAEGFVTDKDGNIDKEKLNSHLAQSIKDLFYNGTLPENIEVDDKYVDQLISQLLSAATDNAKELLLIKLNAGTDYAKYYLHLMMMGFSLDDIVSFMTSPVVELIDKFSKDNLYAQRINTIKFAIKFLEGDFKPGQFLVAEKVSAEVQEAQDEMEMEEALAQAEGDEDFENQDSSNDKIDGSFPWVISELRKVGLYQSLGAKSVQDFTKKYINLKLRALNSTPEQLEQDPLLKYIADKKLPTVYHLNTNKYFKMIESLISEIQQAIANQNTEGRPYTLQDFQEDLNQFKSLTHEADETSTLASTWLKLNQGIPQTDMDLIKLVKKMEKSVSRRESVFNIKRLKEAKPRYTIVLADEDEQEEQDANTYKEKKEDVKSVLVQAADFITQNGWDIDISKVNSAWRKYIQMLLDIHSNNEMLDLQKEILPILLDAIEADLFGNFDLYKYLGDTEVKLTEHEFKNTTIRYYGNSAKIGYRELAARYYNLIKSSWNILDIMRRIPHYKLNIDLLNYTLQAKDLFSIKAKLIDRLINLGDLSYITLTDKQYGQVIKYADAIINTSFFFSIKEPIPIGQFKVGLNLPVVFDGDYEKIPTDSLHLDSLEGIDSLKHFVENEFLEYLRSHYADNELVKGLMLHPNEGKVNLRTRLNLDFVNSSIVNKQTYTNYLMGLKQLAQEKVKYPDGTPSSYSLADILALYNLAVYGTRTSGKYLTGVFKDSVIEGTKLYDYYQFISSLDFNKNLDKVLPTKKDFLMYLAPVVYSRKALQFRNEPYVKLASTTKGFILCRRLKNGEYVEESLEDLLNLPFRQDQESKDQKILDYLSSTINLFPELRKRMAFDNVFRAPSMIQEKISKLVDAIAKGLVTVTLNCKN